jgi:hypothetical protein
LGRLRVGALVVLVAASCSGSSTQGRQENLQGIHVVGNRLVDARNRPIQLRGANEQGSEYACVGPIYNPERLTFFDGPVGREAIAAMKRWRINAVRIPLNEDCWLGLNPVERGGEPEYRIRIIRDDPDAGTRLAHSYRRAIKDYVARLHRLGLIAILDLHWSAPGDSLAFDQWPMPDADHSPTFWRSVAKAFRDDHELIFEVFNEPFFQDAERLPWSCLRDGCVLPNACADCADGVIPDGSVAPGCDACPTPNKPDGEYRAAGTQALVDAIRSTGAEQPILVPGRNYTNDLGRWLAFRPKDPLKQIGAAFHGYEGLTCDDEECWKRTVARVAQRVPVVATEFGPETSDRSEPCTDNASYDRRFLRWADANDVSYISWAWYRDTDSDPSACSLGMLTSYDGAPRAGHGSAVHDHYTSRPE